MNDILHIFICLLAIDVVEILDRQITKICERAEIEEARQS
jgi:hypothetical protein